MPCHQYRFNPVWQKVRRWLDEEAIGRWYLAEFDVYRLMADPGAGRTATPWRGRAAEARGGVLLDHGTHLIYQLLDVAGPPSSVQPGPAGCGTPGTTWRTRRTCCSSSPGAWRRCS